MRTEYRGPGHRAGALLALLLLLTPFATPHAAAQTATPETADERPDAASEEAPAAPAPPTSTHAETITVTATRSRLPLSAAPGHVSVIGREEIEHRLVSDAADLVRYEPGVYADGDPTRLGVGGFNVRGIGGNRLLTRVDGVPTADGFDFGPLAIPRNTLDPEVLQRVEIVRSAVSTLYGSDALGGVVSLVTRDPGDFLRLGDGGDTYLGGRLGWDGRRNESAASLTAARGGERWQGSLSLSHRDGGERDNQGTVDSEGPLRTAPNPIDRNADSLLGKLTYAASPSVLWKLSAQLFDQETATEAFSLRGAENLGPMFGPGVTYVIDTADFDAEDTHRRWQLALERTAQSDGPLFDTSTWRIYGQRDESEQRTVERRETTIGGGFFGPLSTSLAIRRGLFSFDQETVGGEIELQKGWSGRRAEHRLTYGLALSRDRFETLRDRTDVDPASGAEIPSSTPFPTRYFPDSTSDEIGLFAQDEVSLADGRLLVVPGLRWDRFSLDADESDAIFLAGNPGNPTPVDFDESALSPRLGVVYRVVEPVVVFAQYARGFRAPSYVDVNNGFSNLAFGYRTLPNPDLQPETSDNLEVGVRWLGRHGTLSLVGFDNRYDDFIETAVAAVDPQTGFIDFQPQNVASARIRGVELAAEWEVARGWTLRGAWASIEGDDEERDLPLNSIAPPQLVVGLAHRARSGRWGTELTATLAEAKSESDVDRSEFAQFATPGYEVVDLTAFYELPGGFSLQAGLYNLLDETYWTWPEVAGLGAGSPALDRYTSPGLNAAVALRYRR